MIEINPAEYDYEEYDSCGSATVAILKVNEIKIPLCDKCLNGLNESLSEFNNIIYCHKCKHFIMSESGWIHGGSCQKDGKIEEKYAGYIKCVDCMHTCKDAVDKLLNNNDKEV